MPRCLLRAVPIQGLSLVLACRSEDEILMREARFWQHVKQTRPATLRTWRSSLNIHQWTSPFSLADRALAGANPMSFLRCQSRTENGRLRRPPECSGRLSKAVLERHLPSPHTCCRLSFCVAAAQVKLLRQNLVDLCCSVWVQGFGLIAEQSMAGRDSWLTLP